MDDSNSGAAAPQAEQAAPPRTGLTFGALAYTAQASATALEDGWDIRLSFGGPLIGEFYRYVTAAQARELAAALIAAADHYDSETARLAQAGAQ